MEKQSISYRDTKRFGSLILDYIDHSPDLTPFVNRFSSRAAILEQIKEKKTQKVDRQLLAEELKKQYAEAGIELKGKLKEHIDQLTQENSFTITTGHQLSLFGGPLFVVYKILSVIKICEDLKSLYKEYNFIPVFWQASEDHDFEEINHIHLFNKKVEWNADKGNAVGRMSLKGMDKVIEEVKEILGDSEQSKEIIDLLQGSYLSSPNLSVANRRLIHELFKEDGLVIIDGDSNALKRSFIPLMEKEIQHRTTYELVMKTTSLLDKKYKTLVHPRLVNLFYFKDNQRLRLDFENNRFSLLNDPTSFSEKELLDELKKSPDRFSPNVIIRSLYQEFILPNLMYVGGGGELTYWMQFKAVFQVNNIVFPLLQLRNSILIVDGSNYSKTKKLELEWSDLFRSEDDLIKDYLNEVKDQNAISFDLEISQIKTLTQSLLAKTNEIDQSLGGLVKAEEQRMLNAIETIQKKIDKSLKIREEQRLSQIRSLVSSLFPKGNLQERTDSFLKFYFKYGREILSELKQNIDPFDTEFTILTSKV